MKHICLLSIVFCVFFANCNKSNIVIITDSYQNDFLKNYLDGHNVTYKSQDGYFEITENAESLNALKKLTKIQILRVEVDIQNINNVIPQELPKDIIIGKNIYLSIKMDRLLSTKTTSRSRF